MSERMSEIRVNGIETSTAYRRIFGFCVLQLRAIRGRLEFSFQPILHFLRSLREEIMQDQYWCTYRDRSSLSPWNGRVKIVHPFCHVLFVNLFGGIKILKYKDYAEKISKMHAAGIYLPRDSVSARSTISFAAASCAGHGPMTGFWRMRS
jgi:hypothetical protein